MGLHSWHAPRSWGASIGLATVWHACVCAALVTWVGKLCKKKLLWPLSLELDPSQLGLRCMSSAVSQALWNAAHQDQHLRLSLEIYRYPRPSMKAAHFYRTKTMLCYQSGRNIVKCRPTCVAQETLDCCTSVKRISTVCRVAKHKARAFQFISRVQAAAAVAANEYGAFLEAFE